MCKNGFDKLVDSLKDIKDILENRIEIIEDIARENCSPEKLTIYLFVNNSLRLFADTLGFFFYEMTKEGFDKKAFFFIPNTRVVLDIYSRFLDLSENHSSDNKKALLCIVYQLTTYHKALEGKNYNTTLSIHKSFLETQKDIEFPEKSENFSLTWVRNNNLPRFKTLDQILTEENIRKNSDKTKDIFPLKKIYKIYSNFSEIIHGNPYHYHSGISIKKERFWIIVMLTITSCLLIEIIDREYANKEQARDFRDLLSLIKENRDELTKEWSLVKNP